MEKKDYFCNKCKKYYSSSKTLWTHNKKFHSNDKINKLKCDYCDKSYTFVQGKYFHMKKCKLLHDEKLKEENLLKEKIKIMEKQIEELQNNKSSKITKHINSHNTTNNIVNNIKLVTFGREDIAFTLTDKEKLEVLNKKYMALDYIVEEYHFGNKYPQWHNVIITNLKDNYGYKYDEKYNSFIKIKKENLFDDIIDGRLCDIQLFLESNIKNVSKKVVDKINDLVNSIKTDEKFRNDKIEDLKLIIYNNSINRRNEIK